MKMHVYLSVVVGVLLLGFALNYVQNKDKFGETVYYAAVENPERFQELGQQFAERTRTGPLSAWMVSGGEGDIVVVDGMDGEGQQLIKCVFDQRTSHPLSILCFGSKTAEVSDVPRTKLRETAAWWLKRVITPEQDGWHWLRDGAPSPYRYLSVWHCREYDAFLSVNIKTGQLIALRLNPPNTMTKSVQIK